MLSILISLEHQSENAFPLKKSTKDRILVDNERDLRSSCRTKMKAPVIERMFLSSNYMLNPTPFRIVTNIFILMFFRTEASKKEKHCTVFTRHDRQYI